MALGIETVTLVQVPLATSNLAQMGHNVRNTQTLASPSASKIVAACVGADLAAVVLFVVVGRLSHEEGLGAAGLLRTGWPFVVGLVGGYIGVALTRWPALSLRGGTVIAVKTVLIGLVLRYGVVRDGTPFSFVVVTALVLTVLLLGWRLLAISALRRSTTG